MRRRHALGPLVAAVVVVATGAPASAMASGDLDPSFSGDGQAFVQVSSTAQDEAKAVAITPDGHVVIVGRVQAADEGDFAVVRLKPDGYPDLTFSGDGRMTFSVADDELLAVAVQPNGEIVAGGGSDQRGLLIARITTAGKLDHTFGGGDGLATVPSVFDAEAVALQKDGKILAVASIFGTDTFAVLRFTASGKLDPTFDHDGKRIIAIPGANNPEAADVAVDSHGRIVAAAESGDTVDRDVDVFRLLPNGAFDHSFSGDGKVDLDFGPDDGDAHIALQSNDKIVVGEDFTPPGGNQSIGLVRIAADGDLDSTFAGDGREVLNLAAESVAFDGLALQSNNAIVLTGETTDADSQVFVARIGAGGKPDPTLGGTLFLNPTNGSDDSNGVAVGGGKIVMAGTADNGSTKVFYAARLFQ
jgi:uncharacterized delta-60 repeat protein